MVPWWYLLLKRKNQTAPQVSVEPFSGDSAGIQTRNLLIRSQMLYSVKLRNQAIAFLKSGAKIPQYFHNQMLLPLFFILFSFLSVHSLRYSKRILLFVRVYPFSKIRYGNL